ncbi:5732_t:CDS:1, partial [Cetraspora pellucida]
MHAIKQRIKKKGLREKTNLFLKRVVCQSPIFEKENPDEEIAGTMKHNTKTLGTLRDITIDQMRNLSYVSMKLV